MAVRSKKYRQAASRFDRQAAYPPQDAIRIAKELAYANFDETVEAVFRLGIDPRKADQNVRGTIRLPHGTGKTKKVAVFAEGEKAREAEEAGADIVGGQDLVARVEKGFLDFDVAIATPDIMSQVGKVGKILGPRGLMPNPKSGTVTFDVADAVRDFKAGKIEYRNDRTGNVHVPIGKVSFDVDKLVENFAAVAEELIRAKPPTAKGRYIKKAAVSSTMGPGIKIDPLKVRP
ncbi:MAG: 50S ribosomal protein L1 [Acidimicrobiia bacterium]